MRPARSRIALLVFPPGEGGFGRVPVAKNAAEVNLGADWKLSSNVKLDANYNGQWADSAKDQATSRAWMWRSEETCAERRNAAPRFRR